MNENEILGFDPSTLSIFFDVDRTACDLEEHNENFDESDYERDLEELEWEKKIEEKRDAGISKKFGLIHRYKYRPLNIYLAGKIKANGWRQSIVDIRNGVMVWGNYTVDYFKNLKLHYKDDIYINGPFFLSCDHSCYHGEGDHGVGIYSPWGCYGEKTFTQQEVNDICLTQIKNADIIFAYINDNTCYGSIYEIGYAAAIGKPVIILFDSKQRYRDMWFIAQNAKIVDYVNDKEKYNFNLKERFDKLINTYVE